MPLTPFHIGPVTLIRSISEKLDFIALIYGATLIDIEPFLIVLLRLPYPPHGPTHSIVGVLALTPLIYLATVTTKNILLKMNFPLGKNNRKTLIASIIIGGFTHIILDGFLYPEMSLAWPLSGWNPLFGIFNYYEVYGFCIFSFPAGALLYVARKLFEKRFNY